LLKNWNHSQTGEYIAVKRGGGMVFCRESQALMNIFFVLDEIFFSLWPQKCRFSVHCSFLERVLKKNNDISWKMIRRGEIRGPITWNCCFFLFIKQTAAVFSCLFTFGDHPLVFFSWRGNWRRKKGGRSFYTWVGAWPMLLLIYSAAGGASPASASSVVASEVQRVKLSRKSCMINVESL